MKNCSRDHSGKIAVVVPSLKASQGLLYAVNSILGLNSADLQVVISINSSSEYDVENARKLFTQKQVRVISPGKLLPHAEHWNFAIKSTSSEWVTLLTDRSTFRMNWLEKVSAAATEADIISYKSMAVLKHGAFYQVQLPWFSGANIYSEPDAYISLAAKMVFPANAPYLLNTLIRRTAVDKLLERFGRVCGDVVGDCGFFSSVLAAGLSWTFIDEPLIVMHSAESGIGSSLVSGTRTSAVDSLLASMSGHTGFIEAPIPEIVTNMNIRTHEHVSAFRKAGRETEARIDLKLYCRSIYSELLAQTETFPKDAIEQLKRFANSNGVTPKSLPGHSVKSARRLIRDLLQQFNPATLGQLGRILNLPIARFTSLEKALNYSVISEFKPNKNKMTSDLWR